MPSPTPTKNLKKYQTFLSNISLTSSNLVANMGQYLLNPKKFSTQLDRIDKIFKDIENDLIENEKYNFDQIEMESFDFDRSEFQTSDFSRDFGFEFDFESKNPYVLFDQTPGKLKKSTSLGKQIMTTCKASKATNSQNSENKNVIKPSLEAISELILCLKSLGNFMSENWENGVTLKRRSCLNSVNDSGFSCAETSLSGIGEDDENEQEFLQDHDHEFTPKQKEKFQEQLNLWQSRAYKYRDISRSLTEQCQILEKEISKNKVIYEEKCRAKNEKIIKLRNETCALEAELERLAKANVTDRA